MRAKLSIPATVPLNRPVSAGESPLGQNVHFDHGFGAAGLLTPKSAIHRNHGSRPAHALVPANDGLVYTRQR